MWTQIVGKIRLKLAPLQNHWWNVPLYVTARGLTTSAIAYDDRLFQIDFDLIDHMLIIETTDGSIRKIALRSCSVAEFYQDTMDALDSLKMPVTIWSIPVEVPVRTPFEEDQKHGAYDREYVQRCWRILVQSSRILTKFLYAQVWNKCVIIGNEGNKYRHMQLCMMHQVTYLHLLNREHIAPKVRSQITK